MAHSYKTQAGHTFAHTHQKTTVSADPHTTSQDANSASEEVEGSATAGAAPASEDADAAAPSIAQRNQTQAKEHLAGLKLSGAVRQNQHDEDMSDAVDRKMSELQASGWRPEEEDGQAEDDDDDYGDVDLISDSDDRDTSMRKEETLAFSAVAVDEEEDEILARRLSLASSASDDAMMTAYGYDAAFKTEEPSIMDFMTDSFFSDRFDRDATPMPDPVNQDSSLTQRRVRFEDELDELDGSDVESTDNEAVADTYPDLFMPAESLGPAFQQTMDDEVYLDDGSDAGSCWDFEGDEMQIDVDDEENDTSDSSGSSSGYESDDGETTDEEAPPPPSSCRQRIAAVRPSTADSVSSAADSPPAPLGKGAGKKRKADAMQAPSQSMPVAGTFILDPHRPVLLVNGTGSNQRNTFYPAKIQTAADRRFWQRLQSHYQGRNSSPRTSVQLTPDEDNDLGSFVGQSLDINSPDAFFSALGILHTDQVLGPPEAFMAFTDVDAGGFVTEEASMQSFSDVEEQEDYLDFLNLDDDDEEEEDTDMPEESEAPDSPFTNSSKMFPHLSSKPASRKGSVGGSVGDDLLAHLDRNRALVGSFRRNQHLAKHVGSLASHPSLRASTSEVNAMQTGRRAAANTPITPLRKKRGGKNVGARDSPTFASPTKPVPRKNGPVRGGFTRGR